MEGLEKGAGVGAPGSGLERDAESSSGGTTSWESLGRLTWWPHQMN